MKVQVWDVVIEPPRFRRALIPLDGSAVAEAVTATD